MLSTCVPRSSSKVFQGRLIDGPTIRLRLASKKILVKAVCALTAPQCICVAALDEIV